MEPNTDIKIETIDEFADRMIANQPERKDELNQQRAIAKARQTYIETAQKYGIIPAGYSVGIFPDWNNLHW